MTAITNDLRATGTAEPRDLDLRGKSGSRHQELHRHRR
jgi:hypothetical protein